MIRHRSGFFSAVLLLALFVLGTIPTFAQNTVTASTASGGNWTGSSTWICVPPLLPCVLNNTASDVFNVQIDGGETLLNSSSSLRTVTIGGLSINNPSEVDPTTLGINDGESLVVTGNLTNNVNNEIGSAEGQQPAQPGLALDGIGSGGSRLTVKGNLTNTGLIYIGDPFPGATSASTLTVDGSFNNAGGALVGFGGSTVATEATMNIAGVAPSTFTGDVFLYGAILNYQAGGQITQIGDGTNVSGALDLGSPNSYVEAGGVPGNSALGSLTTIASNGQLWLSGGATFTTGGPLVSDGNLIVGASGAQSTLTVIGNLTASGSTTVYTSGELEVTNSYTQTGGTTTVYGALTASSLVISGAQSAASINTGGILTVLQGGSYTQSAGTTDVDGTLISPTVTITTGTLRGDGTIEGNVTVALVHLQPGDPTGTLRVSGNLDMSDSIFDEEITNIDSYGVLDVSGTLSFSDINLILAFDTSDFIPTNGEVFDIVNAGSISGMFSNPFIPFDGGVFDVDLSSAGCTWGSNCIDLVWHDNVTPAREDGGTLQFLSVDIITFFGLYGLIFGIAAWRGWHIRAVFWCACD